MIHATIPLSHFTALDDAMTAVLTQQFDNPLNTACLSLLCEQAMGRAWCWQFDTPTEAAAMIVAMALLKQIEIVEDRA